MDVLWGEGAGSNSAAANVFIVSLMAAWNAFEGVFEYHICSPFLIIRECPVPQLKKINTEMTFIDMCFFQPFKLL